MKKCNPLVLKTTLKYNTLRIVTDFMSDVLNIAYQVISLDLEELADV